MDTAFSEAFDGLVTKLEGWFATIIHYLPNIALAILVSVAAYFVAKYVNNFTYKIISKE
ncbi:mechanosensitive ion channel family protein [Algibacter lectus]|uniref:Uncharacterized protein n=1 Tax=Algibacter lectus TaxID=221126 RepID=A0A090VLM9_9FLAO|nr:hypothetical protein JCM19300_433 [Algibacter lectus]